MESIALVAALQKAETFMDLAAEAVSVRPEDRAAFYARLDAAEADWHAANARLA